MPNINPSFAPLSYENLFLSTGRLKLFPATIITFDVAASLREDGEETRLEGFALSRRESEFWSFPSPLSIFFFVEKIDLGIEKLSPSGRLGRLAKFYCQAGFLHYL